MRRGARALCLSQAAGSSWSPFWERSVCHAAYNERLVSNHFAVKARARINLQPIKALLSGHTNVELRIDSQFSRPAIENILEDFAKSVKGCDSLNANCVSF